MLKDKVRKTILNYKLINNGDKIVVGVSGGPDSMCLLHVLMDLKNEFNIEIFVAHINHMIRENAILDEEFVRNFCRENKIDCFVKRKDVLKISKEEKIGTEEAGRKVRYDFFEEILKETGSNKIAIAHNLNDNAETIIMNILRGSGTQGLKGIDEIKDNKYIRPLIKCSREEIEDYCKLNKLNPRHDESNDENIYTRNKIRNIIIPYIKKEFNPNFVNTINRLSEIAKEESLYIDKIVKNNFDSILVEKNDNKIVLDLDNFNKLDVVIKRRLILYTINILFGTTRGIEKIHIEDIIKLCQNNIGNKFLTPNKNTKVLVKNKKIFITIENNIP